MDAKNYTCKERKTSYFICLSLPLEVAFETPHFTSFFISNSSFASTNKSGGDMLALITTYNVNGVN
jgi:hypothetical protein